MARTPSITSSVKQHRVPFKYCSRDVDRHGNERFYVRLPGRPKHRMKSPYLDASGRVTAEFSAEYHRVINATAAGPAKSGSTLEVGSIRWLVEKYYRSKAFQNHSAATQSDKRSVLGRYCDGVGHLPYRKLRKSDIEASQMKRKGTPGAADKLVKYLKALFNWAIASELADTNPTIGVTKINKSDGFHSWREQEMEVFRAAYPIGTTARLAFELMLNLGVRRSDLVTLGRKNIIEDRIEFRPSKATGAARRPLISLPIPSDLQKALNATSHTGGTFLINEYGHAFTSNGFGNKMRQWCDEAGLPDCSSHGLRKASATILAEAGATEHQLMAIFGWSDSKMAQHYTKSAQSKRIIDAGFERRETYLADKNVPLSERRKAGETKRRKNNGKTTPQVRDGGPGGPANSRAFQSLAKPVSHLCSRAVPSAWLTALRVPFRGRDLDRRCIRPICWP